MGLKRWLLFVTQSIKFNYKHISFLSCLNFVKALFLSYGKFWVAVSICVQDYQLKKDAFKASREEPSLWMN